MTDERGLDAAAEEQVRRLLAAARHDGPAPDDVVARIDAALRAEGRPGTTAADELAARRRRRRWTGGLAAAALVVVAGVGAGATGLLDSTGSGSESGSDAGGSAPAAGDAGPEAADEDAGSDGSTERRGLGGLDEFSTEGQARSYGSRPRVRTGESFVADVRAALDLADDGRLPPPPALTRCAPPDTTGRVVGVRFEGRRADLVAAPVDDVLEVALWVCGDATDPERTVELPAG